MSDGDWKLEPDEKIIIRFSEELRTIKDLRLEVHGNGDVVLTQEGYIPHLISNVSVISRVANVGKL